MSLPFHDIDTLADILNRHDLGELSLKDGDFELILKAKLPPPQAVMMSAPAPAGAAAPIPAAATAACVGNVMTAPIVGTFYASAAPDKPAFARVGDQVKKGDILFIIESMKLMNEIQSEFDGTITEILVKDGQGVEFHQPVLVIQ